MEQVLNIGGILTNPLSKLVLIDSLNFSKKKKKRKNPSLKIIQCSRRETRPAYTENFIPIETQRKCVQPIKRKYDNMFGRLHKSKS